MPKPDPSAVYAPCQPTQHMLEFVHEVTMALRSQHTTYKNIVELELPIDLILPDWVFKQPERGYVSTNDASRLIYELMIQQHCSEEFT